MAAATLHDDVFLISAEQRYERKLHRASALGVVEGA